MPAARQRSRSPFMAWAVMAMIGRWRAGRLLARADGGGRLEAVHLRHLHVHQHEVERLPRPGPPAPRGRCRPRRPWWPRFSSRPTASLWLTGLSSASRTPQRRRPAPAAAAAGAAAAALERSRTAPRRGQDRVEQRRLPDRLGQVGGDAQLAAAGGVVAPVGRREHHQGRAGQRRVAAGSARPA